MPAARPGYLEKGLLVAPCLEDVAPGEPAIGRIEGENRRERLSVAAFLEGVCLAAGGH